MRGRLCLWPEWDFWNFIYFYEMCCNSCAFRGLVYVLQVVPPDVSCDLQEEQCYVLSTNCFPNKHIPTRRAIRFPHWNCLFEIFGNRCASTGNMYPLCSIVSVNHRHRKLPDCTSIKINVMYNN